MSEDVDVDFGRVESTVVVVLVMKEEIWEASISRLNPVVFDAHAPMVVGGFVPMARVEDPICICFVRHQRSVAVEEAEGVDLAERQQFVVETFCRLLHKIGVECKM